MSDTWLAHHAAPYVVKFQTLSKVLMSSKSVEVEIHCGGDFVMVEFYLT